MIRYLKKIQKLLFKNSFEKKFLNNQENDFSKKFLSKNNKKIILFQTPMDYYFVLITRTIIFEKHLDSCLIGIWPYFINPLKKRSIILFEFFHYFKNVFFFLMLKAKWKKIYKKNNINLLENFSSYNLKSILFSIKNFKKITQQIKSKKDILKIKFEGIHIGDLLFDSYIRYRAKPYVNKNDFFLKYIIFKTLVVYYNSTNFIKKNNIEIYYTSYASYINHGLLVRVFLSNKIKVYSLSSYYGENYVTMLTSKRPHAKKNYNNLFLDFERQKNRRKKIDISRNLLKQRFFGDGDLLTKYIDIKPNYKPVNEKNFNYEGVVFLHDFYDAPREIGLRIFTDFYEWYEFLNYIIKKNDLHFAFKFHPNTKTESKVFNSYLKKNYDCKFLDPKISNLSIYKNKNFKTGISVCGSVLYELLYFRKIPIYLSNNLISPLNIHKLPKNKNEYEKLIVNYNKIKINNKMIIDMLKIYYMTVSDQSDSKCVIAKKVGLKDANFTNLNDIIKYFEKTEMELKKFKS
jgi:hypothetical protein